MRAGALGLSIALSAAGVLAQEAAAIGGSVPAADALVSVQPRIEAEAPAKQPKVVCRGNEMAISAENSTLGSILAGVHRCIGVQIDIPEDRSGTRIFGDIGPGPVREVLDALLSGTELNYAIGSTGADPNKVDSVLLMVRSNDLPKAAPGPSGEFALTPARRAWMSTQKNNRPTAGSAPEDRNRASVSDPEGAPPSEEAATAQPADPVSAAAAPSANPPAASSDVTPAPPAESDPAPASGAKPAPAQDRSTEDRITDMQQMFEQRRQMLASQSSSPK